MSRKITVLTLLLVKETRWKCRWNRLCMDFIIKPEFVKLQVHVQHFFLAFVNGKFEK